MPRNIPLTAATSCPPPALATCAWRWALPAALAAHIHSTSEVRARRCSCTPPHTLPWPLACSAAAPAPYRAAPRLRPAVACVPRRPSITPRRYLRALPSLDCAPPRPAVACIPRRPRSRIAPRRCMRTPPQLDPVPPLYAYPAAARAPRHSSRTRCPSCTPPLPHLWHMQVPNHAPLQHLHRIPLSCAGTFIAPTSRWTA
jgi:hypothetical protein